MPIVQERILRIWEGLADSVRILIVEDTADVADAIQSRFSAIGHACDIARDCAEALHYLQADSYDLVILDINLPDGSGFDVLKVLRAKRNTVPVLVLTARLAVDDRVNALDVGADDYLVKPFDFRELEARVRAIVRRHHGEAHATIAAGRLTLDTASRSVEIDGRPCELTRRELVLLEIFLTHQGRVLAKDELHAKLFALEEDVGLNAVELYVARLRRHIAGSGFDIKTLRGLGYQGLVAGHD